MVDFQNLMKVEFCWRKIFENLIIHKPSLDHVMSHTKFGPDRFSRFDVYWIQTKKQTDRQAKFIYRSKIALIGVQSFANEHPKINVV